MENKRQEWLSSKEAKKVLKVSDCHLMHMRLAGKLQFRKEGNRYFYLIPMQPEK
jgi:Zn-finger protein